MSYQVLSNKTIRGADGNRFIVRGVTMFDYLLDSFETRSNYNFRERQFPAGKGAAYGISEPTYFARSVYVNAAHIRQTLKTAWNNNVNLIRVAVEPAVMYASVSYVDPADGLTYPSDPDMLDDIIAAAGELGMVVQLQPVNDNSLTADNVTFLSWLGNRYLNTGHVWIDTANEVNGYANGAVDVHNASIWAAEVRQYMLAIRSSGFKNPVCVDLPSWSSRIDTVYNTLTTDTAFSKDPNMILQIHYYPAPGETDFRTARLPVVLSQWVNYIGQFCIVVGEVGIDNLAGRYDPNLDPGVPSVNVTAWEQMKASSRDFLTWCRDKTKLTSFSGVIGTMWTAYVYNMTTHDDNSMRQGGLPYYDADWSMWGTIFRDRYLSPPVVNYLESIVDKAVAVPFVSPGGSINITSIILKPGTWDVVAEAAFLGSSGVSLTRVLGSISILSQTPNLSAMSILQVPPISPGATTPFAIPVVSTQISVGVDTPVYLVQQCSFSGGSMSGYGALRATKTSMD